MDTGKQKVVRFQFSAAIDVLTAFEQCGIEHLEVSNERTIVIYQRTIFNFDVLHGQLNAAQTVAVEVFDISPDLDANTDPVSLIDHLIDEVITATGVDCERQLL